MQNEKAVNQSGAKSWSAWPGTFKALKETYFTQANFGHPGELPANGNYMLAGLQRYADYVREVHGHHGFSQAVLDGAAAHEIFYVWNRGRKFGRTAAALSACIHNIAVERPERLLERQTRMTKTAKRIGEPTKIEHIL